MTELTEEGRSVQQENKGYIQQRETEAREKDKKVD